MAEELSLGIAYQGNVTDFYIERAWLTRDNLPSKRLNTTQYLHFSQSLHPGVSPFSVLRRKKQMLHVGR